MPFSWGEKEEESYRQIIEALESAGALHPYDTSLELVHVTDAQPSGIASSLYMITEEKDKATWWPLDHLSRSLTPAEEGYPQIDRESLAQSWGMQQFRYYLLGRKFTTYCDYEPLLPFYNGKKKATPRVEKHILANQDLDFEMKYIRGKDNPTDWNSRHPESLDLWSQRMKEKHKVDTGEELRLNKMEAASRVYSILRDIGAEERNRVTIEMISEAAANDAEYQTVRDLVEKGKVNEVKGEYSPVAKELAVTEGILIRGEQLVIPQGEDGGLRKDILTAAHQGHQGISQLKTKLRSAVYWPNSTKDAEEEVKECLACQATTTRRHHADMLTPSEPPGKIWEKVGADHWGPLPDGS